LLLRSMEYWKHLLYKRYSVLRRAREYKKRHGPFTGPMPPGYRTDGGVGWLAGARCS
jgi:hypothetical protein